MTYSMTPYPLWYRSYRVSNICYFSNHDQRVVNRLTNNRQTDNVAILTLFEDEEKKGDNRSMAKGPPVTSFPSVLKNIQPGGKLLKTNLHTFSAFFLAILCPTMCAVGQEVDVWRGVNVDR